MLLGHLGAKHKKIHEVLLNDLDETEEKECYSDQPNRPNGKMECGLCPQNFSGKSLLYQHYSKEHFEKEMMTFVDSETNICKFCDILIRRPKDMIAHVGSVHDKVENFLPDELKINNETQSQDVEDIRGQMEPLTEIVPSKN